MKINHVFQSFVSLFRNISEEISRGIDQHLAQLRQSSKDQSPSKGQELFVDGFDSAQRRNSCSDYIGGNGHIQLKKPKVVIVFKIDR